MHSVLRIANRYNQINVLKQVIRYRSRNFAKRKRAVDPGIQKRKDLVNEEQEFQQLSDYDFDLEADFMNVGKTYDQHMHEASLQREKEKYFIVKEKYFKEKLPNFLTWSDKQQIRYLYNTNPDEWTIERLSEGFPAVPEVIAKIAKSTWTKRSDHQIQNHDAAVQRNWSLFKESKLSDLPPEVTEHLQKFSDRELNTKPFEIPEDMKMKNKKNLLAPNIKIGTEFSDIIKSYEGLKNKSNSATEPQTMNVNKIQKPTKGDTYVLSGAIQNSKHTTLGNLENGIVRKAQIGKLDSDEKVILQELKENENYQLKETSLEPTSSTQRTIDLVENKFASSRQVSTVVKDPKNYSFLEYPEKISIPKNKLKQGYTYKLNDCYYDDDGEFLYRVPGMYK